MYYLFGSIFLLIIFILLISIRSDLRKQGVLSGVLFIVYGPISEIIFFQDYWQPDPVLPPVLIAGYNFLLEDFIYAFAIVGIMSSIYDFIFKKRLKENLYKKRYLFAIIISLLSLASFLYFSLNTQVNSIFVSSGVAIFFGMILVWFRRDLFKTSIITGGICGMSALIFYFLILQFPGAVDYLYAVWKLPVEQAAYWILGKPIPLTEILWAFSTPIFFSIIFKFAVGSGYYSENRQNIFIAPPKHSESLSQ